jgi:hypothetical protein
MNTRLLHLPLAWLTLGFYLLGHHGLEAETEEETLPLPKWSEGDLQAMRNSPSAVFVLGGDLWPVGGMLSETDSPIAQTPVPNSLELGKVESQPSALPATAPLDIADRPETAQPRTDLSHFMPPELLKSRQTLPKPKPGPGELRDVSAEFLLAAAHSPVSEHLIDPDSNLGETHSEDIRRFLEFHAKDARIDAYLMVSAADERLPNNVNLSPTAGGVLLGQEGCLVVYPFGQPHRARLFLSRSVHDSVPSPYLASLLEDCVSDASQASDADDQLHRFLVRLSIRLFWLERMLPPKSEVMVANSAANPLPATPTSLSEIGNKAAAEGLSSSLLNIQLDARVWKWGATTAVLLLGLLGVARWHHYRLRHYVWILPEPVGVSPRLGGAQGGGTAAWIRYR